MRGFSNKWRRALPAIAGAVLLSAVSGGLATAPLAALAGTGTCATATGVTETSGPASGQLDTSWTTNGNCPFYALYAYSYTGTPSEVVTANQGNLEIGGLTPGAEYVTTVIGYDGSAWGPAWAGWSGWAQATATPTPSPTPTPPPPTNPNLGPNVHIFNPSMSNSSIQSTLDSVFNAQQSNQFGSRRDALLFMPGSYNVTANIGFNTSIMGLGLNPDATHITGNVVTDAQWFGGNATQNFWRSASNLELTPSGGTETWAVAQAAPFRRMDVQGNLNLYPSPPGNGWASGGYISDSRVTGQVNSGSQQQWFSRNSQFGSWNGANWNMVFAGVQGAPSNTFPNPPWTTLAQTPVSREEPFLYVDGSGGYHVFVPSLQHNSSGTTWANGSTPGTSLSLGSFFIAQPSNSAADINAALAGGENLLLTPGIYSINQTINVTRADTVVLGIGYPTLIPQGGVDTMHVADVPGVTVSSILFDAGPQTSNALLTIGTKGSTGDNSADPVVVDDAFFRIGGDQAGSATTSLVDNSNNSIIDHIWAWRADHGNGVGWTTNQADTGLVVNADNVTAMGLFVEHYQKNEIIWNGQGGEDIFLQNENPYDPPSQSAWMSSSSQKGYPALYLAPSVTSFQAYGLGSYCFFNNGSIHNAMAIQAPNNGGVHFHDLMLFSSGNGGIDSIINGTGVHSGGGTADLVSYP